MGNFRNLLVWQNAKDLAVDIYKLTREEGLSKDFGLRDQMQRAAVSIASNIAEGDELGTDKQSIRHFYISRGSVAELITQLTISYEIGYIDNSAKETLINECDKICTMLKKLIKARSEFK